MKFILILSTLFCLFPNHLPAALPVAWGARHLALGQSGVADAGSRFSLFINPALPTTDSESWNFDLALLNLYLLPGLYQATGQIRYNHNRLPFLGGWNSFGNTLYQEHHFRGGFSFRPAGDFHLAVSADYFLQNIVRYGQASAISAGCSGYWKSQSDFSAGFSLDHLFHSRWKNRSDTLPVLISTGVQYHLTEYARVNIDLVREEGHSFEYRLGGIFSAVQGFEILFGLRSPVEVFSAGFLFTQNDYTLGYGFAWHPVLGFSNAASFHLDL